MSETAQFERYEPVFENRAAQPYLAVSRRVTNGVPAAVDDVFPLLVKWLGERRIVPSGPPFIRVREIDAGGEALELEVAVPVAAEVLRTATSTPGRFPPAAR